MKAPRRSRYPNTAQSESPLLENAILSGISSWRETVQPKPGAYYWRTAGGAEVDFVLSSGSRLLPVEVKTSQRIHLGDLRHLEIFLTDYAQTAPFALILYDTERAQLITRQVIGMPVSWFL